jgi:hypothetical protein
MLCVGLVGEDASERNDCRSECGGGGGARLSGREDEFICERLQVYDEDFMSSTCKQIACDLFAFLRDDCLALSFPFSWRNLSSDSGFIAVHQFFKFNFARGSSARRLDGFFYIHTSEKHREISRFNFSHLSLSFFHIQKAFEWLL